MRTTLYAVVGPIAVEDVRPFAGHHGEGAYTLQLIRAHVQTIELAGLCKG